MGIGSESALRPILGRFAGPKQVPGVKSYGIDRLSHLARSHRVRSSYLSCRALAPAAKSARL